jgi:hypothetical protein
MLNFALFNLKKNHLIQAKNWKKQNSAYKSFNTILMVAKKLNNVN